MYFLLMLFNSFAIRFRFNVTFKYSFFILSPISDKPFYIGECQNNKGKEGETKVTGNNKIYTKYKRLIELLNLRQLDVYRVEGKDGKIKEIVRLLDPTTRKVANVDLNTVRESLSYIEFLNKIKEGVSKEGININDRVWNSILKLLNKNK